MTNVRTLRFHTKYGPTPLFDKARQQLTELAGLSLEIPHAKSRFEERGIPMEHLTDFQPEDWEVMTVETNVRTGRITYMSLRRSLESRKYLWIVLAFEHVITAWIRDTPRSRVTGQLIVKDGPAWDAAARGEEPIRTQAVAEWAAVQARSVRARDVLAALDALAEHPSGDRLRHAANLVLAGSTWKRASIESGWASPQELDTAIGRLLQEVTRNRPAAAEQAPACDSVDPDGLTANT